MSQNFSLPFRTQIYNFIVNQKVLTFKMCKDLFFGHTLIDFVELSLFSNSIKIKNLPEIFFRNIKMSDSHAAVNIK